MTQKTKNAEQKNNKTAPAENTGNEMHDFHVELNLGNITRGQIVRATSEKEASRQLAKFFASQGIKYTAPQPKTIILGHNENVTHNENNGDVVTWKFLNHVQYPTKNTEHTAITVEDEIDKMENEAEAIEKSKKYETERREIFNQRTPKVYKRPVNPKTKSYDVPKSFYEAQKQYHETKFDGFTLEELI